MSTLRMDRIDQSKLLLDPNNYRFQDIENFVYAKEDRFHEDSVQERAMRRIRTESNLIDLKRSILRSGFMEVERLVVRPYPYIEDRWVVIEGNRRLAAARWLLDDHEAGADVPDELIESIRELPVAIAEEHSSDEVFRASLMGIRHVSGIDEWGGYQRAKLVAVMRDDLGLDTSDVAERLGLSATEVNRRYRAYKALQQMQNHEEYGEYAKPSLYPIFHEAVSLPVVKDWLEWNEETAEFQNEENVARFYKMLISREHDGSETIEPKIRGYMQVRELRRILPNSEARRLLLDEERPLEDALAAVKKEEFSRLWQSEVSNAIDALENMGIEELKRIDKHGLDLLSKLKDLLDVRFNDYYSLTKSEDKQ